MYIYFVCICMYRKTSEYCISMPLCAQSHPHANKKKNGASKQEGYLKKRDQLSSPSECCVPLIMPCSSFLVWCLSCQFFVEPCPTLQYVNLTLLAADCGLILRHLAFLWMETSWLEGFSLFITTPDQKWTLTPGSHHSYSAQEGLCVEWNDYSDYLYTVYLKKTTKNIT